MTPHHSSPRAGPPQQPFVVCLALDARTEGALTTLRDRWFPQRLNHLTSHLTFFHALPADRLEDYKRDLAHLAAMTSPLPISTSRPFKMGRGGIAVPILSDPSSTPSIEQLHAKLLGRLRSLGVQLTEQDDRELHRPHVTVMNKVDDEKKVEEALAGICKGWKSRDGSAVALELFEYQKGGEWRPVGKFPFTKSSDP